MWEVLQTLSYFLWSFRIIIIIIIIQNNDVKRWENKVECNGLKTVGYEWEGDT